MKYAYLSVLLACAQPSKAVISNVPASLQALSPATLPPAPVDVTNKYADDAGAARLGQRFFYDPGFSGALVDGDDDGSPDTLGHQGDTGKVACAGCHVPDGGFSDTRTRGGQISLGAAWGKRRAPSLLDVGQAKLLMWDGRHDALYNQPFGPIETSFEMNSSRLYVAEQIAARYATDYAAVFGALPDFSDTARFPALLANESGCKYSQAGQPPCAGAPGDKGAYDSMSAADQDAVTRVVVNMGKALAAFERKLTCGTGRFDAWVHGDETAMSAAEQRGALLFVGKAECVTCHSGPFMSDQQFHNLGLTATTVAIAFIDLGDHGARDGLSAAIADPLNTHGTYADGDDGRLPTTVDTAMDGAFRTPTLRCVSQRPSLFHTGQISSIAAAMHFLNTAPGGVYPGTSEGHALNLSDAEESDLVAFLGALDGPGADASLRAPPP